jgi:glycosyltransferase involved in cell wall biosynthesis
MLSVALCTYNGKEYIEEQLQSLAKQTVLPDELVIVDDGSTDRTMNLIQIFAAGAPFRVRVFQHEHAIGVVANFSEAVGYCEGDYIALCDQDDVWLPNKLAKELDLMRCYEAQFGRNCPILVHSDLCVTDEGLRCKAASLMRFQGIHNEEVEQDALSVLLVQNYVTGCTMVFNRALKQRCWPFPQEAVMHDWWIALVAAAVGKIAFVDESMLLYRQHRDNQVGAKSFFSYHTIQRLFSKRKLEQRIERMARQSFVLVGYLHESDAGAVFVNRYVRRISQRQWYEIKKSGVHAQGWLRNFGLFFCFVLMYRQGSIR